MANRPMIILTFGEWDKDLVRRVRRGQKSALTRELKIGESLFNIVTSQFSAKNQPSWDRRAKLKGDTLEGILETDTPPFPYLAEGTKRRYAILSPDYRKRTTPNRISSGQSRGAAVARGKRNVPAGYARRKAIKPGNWHHVIAKLRGKPWAASMQKQMSLDAAVLHKKIRTVRIL